MPGEARERPRRRRALERLERRDDRLLEDVEHVLALDERHLDVELAELELPVGAQILVPPAGGDLVVAVEAADHEQLLEHLRRLGEREEAARLEAHRDEEVARALGRALDEARRPEVDEAELLHAAADRADHRPLQAEVALHLGAAQVEPAVAQAQVLVDVLLVELERERRRAVQDLERRDLELDLAGRQVRVDRVGGARRDLALGAQHELVADLVGDRCRLGRVLRVDDELADPGVVAQVDEDEPAVVAARVRPAGERRRACRPNRIAARRSSGHAICSISLQSRLDARGTRARFLISVQSGWWAGVPRTLSAICEIWNGSPRSSPPLLSVAVSPSTRTTMRAPRRPAWVIWPLAERPA